MLDKMIKNIEKILQGKSKEVATFDETAPKKSVYHPFVLPIHYLDDKSIHPLSNTVADDLELSKSSSDNPIIYDYLFQPKNRFAVNMIQEWKNNYTTDTSFLKDTQSIIQEFGTFKNTIDNFSSHQVDCDKMLTIWKDTKEDAAFLEKYSYMDWEILAHLNKSSSFLQILSVANITSPLMSLIIPFIFLIFPFIILKIQSIPITFSGYIDTLKEIAKNHFIGKTLMNMQTLSWDKIIYILFTFGLYVMQIYQNINSVFRFYRNVNKINDQLCCMRDHLVHSFLSMDAFVKMHSDKESYRGFIRDVSLHSQRLKIIYDELEPIRPFKPQMSKFLEIGYMLKCYHELYSNPEYGDSIRFSFGYEGYINNLAGIHDNLVNNQISFADFTDTEATSFKDQYYPAYKDAEHVANDCSLNKNVIITGPNASGKTTALKTTTLNIIFTQQVGCGFYSRCTLNPYTHIHSYLNIPDTSGRDSLFQAESRRCKEILDIITETSGGKSEDDSLSKNEDDSETVDPLQLPSNVTDMEPVKGSRHFCIFDELYSGTNPEEATKSAYSFLLYLTQFKNVDFILTTHYVSICKKLNKSKHICNYKMDVVIDKNDKIKYTYRMKKGISKIQGAVRILEEMNYPKEILDSVKNY